MKPAVRLFCVVLPVLAGCTTALQGPAANLHATATPDPVAPAVRVVPQPAPGPLLAPGRWRAWIPRQVQSNGDVTEGHWLDLSLEAPIVEVIEPVLPAPRAPKTQLGRKDLVAPAAKPVSHVPQVPLAPPGGLQGLIPQAGQGLLQGPRLPSPLRPVGGP